MSTEEGKAFLETRGVSKSFGAVRAVSKVDFRINYNEIVGLVGDNGAGKSTLLKMISGVYHPDEGEIFFEGKKATFSTPADSRRVGIEMIYQDLALCDNINVASNIFLGREFTKRVLGTFNVLDDRKMVEESTGVLKTLNITLPSPKVEVGVLSGGQRKAVAIARALYWKAKVILMDEPTAALGVVEVDKVIELAIQLKKRGVSVVFISHNLQEIFRTVDRVVVLRRGEKSGDLRIKETNIDHVIKMMVG